jgi:hypothetical protein
MAKDTAGGDAAAAEEEGDSIRNAKKEQPDVFVQPIFSGWNGNGASGNLQKRCNPFEKKRMPSPPQ